jgi:hypothetical protein
MLNIYRDDVKNLVLKVRGSEIFFNITVLRIVFFSQKYLKSCGKYRLHGTSSVATNK